MKTKITYLKINYLLRYSIIVLLTLIMNNGKAQLSFVNNGQQLNKLAGRGVALSDFNNDGNLDAFVVNEDGPDGNGYRIYFGDGQGQFSDTAMHLINPIPSEINPAIGDINGDGMSEIITGWTVWLNDGYGHFTSDTTCFTNRPSLSFVSIGLADLNGDSSLDVMGIVYGNQINEARVFLNDGHGHFYDTGQRLGQGQSNHSPIVLGDLNNDGHIDAIISGWRTNSGDPCPNRIFINDSTGTFTETAQVLDEGMADSHGLALGDIDSDGDLDLVIGMQGSPFGRTYINDGNGHFTAGQTFSTKFVEKVVLGDFNGDEKLDIFLACNGSNEVWLNDGLGHFSDSGVRLGSEWSWNVALGDFNGDGKLDAFVVNFYPTFVNSVFVPRGRIAEIWLNTTGQTSIKSNKTWKYRIFPNPTNGLFTISIGTTPPNQANFEIYNLQGNPLFSGTFYNTSNATIDLTGYPKGLYVVKVLIEGENFSKKVYLE